MTQNNPGTEHLDASIPVDKPANGRGPVRILQIIHTLDPKSGGPAEAIRQIAHHYAPVEHVGHVLTLDDPNASFLQDLPFPVHAIGPAHSTYAYSPRLVPWLLENQHNYDGFVIHGLWQYIGIAVWRAFAGKKPYIAFPHGMLDPYFKHAFPLKHLKKVLYWYPFEYRVLRDAHSVFFTCGAENELAQQSFALHHWHAQIVPFGASPPEGDPAHYRAVFATAFPVLAQRRFILFLGRIHPKKGCDLLLEAFACVARTDTGLDLVFAGPDQTGWREKLTALAHSFGIGDRVHWTGMVEGEMKWGAFYSCEAFALPSHQENFGIAVAEALACGKPVLLSDKVNIWADVQRAGAAIVAADTLQGTQSVLEQWIALSPAGRVTMCENALQCFKSHYDMSVNACTIVEAFGRIINSAKPAT